VFAAGASTRSQEEAVTGYVKSHRKRFSHHLFAGQKFCRGYAWDWLIAHAAWKPTRVDVRGRTVHLERGQLCYSIRYMAEAWGWDKAAVDRFITRLKTDTMIETATETGQLIITICNYCEYQGDESRTETATETATETKLRQQRDSSETNKKKDKKLEEGNTCKRATRLPEDWSPPEEWIDEAVSRGLTRDRAHAEAERMRNWSQSSPKGAKVNWRSAWRNWIADKAAQTAQPANSQQIVPEVWRIWVKRFQDDGGWPRHEHGPPPGRAGCRCPAEILAEFGYTQSHDPS
jgi:hypothetical protein